MATVALTSTQTLSNTPFLIKKFTMTGGATSLAVTHGESYAPSITWGTIETETPTVTTVIIVPTSATVFTVDCLGDAANAISVYALWIPQATGGLSTITTT